MMKILVALSLLLVCEAEPSRRLDDADCSDDPQWYHKNRGPDYDCAWVALKTDTRCAVKGISPCGNSTMCGCGCDRRAVNI